MYNNSYLYKIKMPVVMRTADISNIHKLNRVIMNTTQIYKNLSLESMPNEIWKDIPDYEGKYQASNLGRIKSLSRLSAIQNGYYITIKERILSCYKRKKYYKASLSKNKKARVYNVHQLVAMAFLSHVPCSHKLVIDHIDNNQSNNFLNNLQIISHRNNLTKDKWRLETASKHIGVSLSKGKYCARIGYKGKRIYLGLFDTEKSANDAYLKALNSIKNNKEIVVATKIFSSKYKGVTYDNTHKKWRSRKTINKKTYYLGYFVSEIEAYNAYKNFKL